MGVGQVFREKRLSNGVIAVERLVVGEMISFDDIKDIDELVELLVYFLGHL